MNKYEELLELSELEGISVDENYPFKGNLSGLYISGNIALSDKLKTTAEKSCVLAEELGHYHTSSGNILDLSNTENRKQEHHARLWAYDYMIGIRGLIAAFRAGCQTRHEISSYLNVTEDFLQDMIDSCRNKYGVGICKDGYYVIFIPNLQIMEMNT